MAVRSSATSQRSNSPRIVLTSLLGLILLGISSVFQASCAEQVITEEELHATPTLMPLPTLTLGPLPVMDMPLPRGIVQEPAELHYGPKHSSMVTLPAGTEFVLLGKNRREEKLDEGTWFRVQIRNEPEVGRVGWIESKHTGPGFLAENTNAIASPPGCAKGVANSIDHFQGVDRLAGTMGIWESVYTGDVVFVIDIYRQIAGELTPPLTFTLKANGKQVAPTGEIKPSRKSFIWRGLVVHANLKKGDKVRLGLQAPDGTIPGEVSWFASAYSVPDGCEFNY